MGKVVELKAKKKVEKPIAIQDNNIKNNVADLIAYTHLNLLFDLMNKAHENKRETITLVELEQLPQQAIDIVVERSVRKLEELEKAEKKEKK